MNIKAIRKVHLYLGLFFSPVIILFLLSGIIQMTQFHYVKYGPPPANGGKPVITYKPPAVVDVMTALHTNVTYKGDRFSTNQFYKYFVLVMAGGLLSTIILGILLAFQYAKPIIVWSILLGGILVPGLLLFL